MGDLQATGLRRDGIQSTGVIGDADGRQRSVHGQRPPVRGHIKRPGRIRRGLPGAGTQREAGVSLVGTAAHQQIFAGKTTQSQQATRLDAKRGIQQSSVFQPRHAQRWSLPRGQQQSTLPDLLSQTIQKTGQRHRSALIVAEKNGPQPHRENCARTHVGTRRVFRIASPIGKVNRQPQP